MLKFKHIINETSEAQRRASRIVAIIRQHILNNSHSSTTIHEYRDFIVNTLNELGDVNSLYELLVYDYPDDDELRNDIAIEIAQMIFGIDLSSYNDMYKNYKVVVGALFKILEKNRSFISTDYLPEIFINLVGKQQAKNIIFRGAYFSQLFMSPEAGKRNSGRPATERYQNFIRKLVPKLWDNSEEYTEELLRTPIQNHFQNFGLALYPVLNLGFKKDTLYKVFEYSFNIVTKGRTTDTFKSYAKRCLNRISDDDFNTFVNNNKDYIIDNFDIVPSDRKLPEDIKKYIENKYINILDLNMILGDDGNSYLRSIFRVIDEAHGKGTVDSGDFINAIINKIKESGLNKKEKDIVMFRFLHTIYYRYNASGVALAILLSLPIDYKSLGYDLIDYDSEDQTYDVHPYVELLRDGIINLSPKLSTEKKNSIFQNMLEFAPIYDPVYQEQENDDGDWTDIDMQEQYNEFTINKITNIMYYLYGIQPSDELINIIVQASKNGAHKRIIDSCLKFWYNRHSLDMPDYLSDESKKILLSTSEQGIIKYITNQY